MMDERDYAIEELAECIKELIRIIQLQAGLTGPLLQRADAVYKKASNAKYRVQT